MKSGATNGTIGKAPGRRPGQDQEPAGRLLLVFAHPDDEAFFTAGTVSRHVAAGGEAWLVSATSGEHGSQPVPPVCAPSEIGSVRARELEESCLIMGVTRLIFLGYEDGHLAEAERTEAVGLIARVMEDFKPGAVVTFGPDGVYGHPDHVAVSSLTEKALDKVLVGRGQGDSKPVGRAGRAAGADPPPRLWHVSLASAFWRYREKAWTAATRDGQGKAEGWSGGAGGWSGGDPGRSGGAGERVGARRALVEGLPEAGIDISATLEAKIAALLAHRTQRHNVERAFGALYDFDRGAPRNPESLAILSREWFTLARGPKPKYLLEHSLLEAWDRSPGGS